MRIHPRWRPDTASTADIVVTWENRRSTRQLESRYDREHR
jgi:hypothetical protein